MSQGFTMSLSHLPTPSAAAENPQPSLAAVNDTAASARQHPVTSALTQGETDDLPPTDPRHPLNNSTSRGGPFDPVQEQMWAQPQLST